jgi:hypothetical protein
MSNCNSRFVVKRFPATISADYVLGLSEFITEYLYNAGFSNSACWNDACDIVEPFNENYQNWIDAYNNLLTYSSLYLNISDTNNLQSLFSTVNSNSAQWSVDTNDGDLEVNNFVYTNSADILDINSVVQNNSALWILSGLPVEDDPIFSLWAQTYSANYESTFNIVFNNSGDWNYQGTDIKSLTSFWQDAYNNLITFSADYLEQPNLSELQSNSSNWNDSYTNLINNSSLYLVDTNDGDLNVNNFVYTNSADILDIESVVQNYSSLWILSGLGEESDPIFTSWVSVYSANYESTFNTVLNNSSTWNYQGTDIKELTSVWQEAYLNLISFSADYLEQVNFTEVQNTSSNWNESYENLINNSALYLIDTNDGDLNVNSFIYANSADILDINTIINEYSALWILVENDPIFTIWAQTYSANYESVYTVVNTNSSAWNYQGTDIKELTSVWQNAYTNLISFSADYLQQPDLSLSSNWTDVYNTVNENSATWNIDTNDGDLNVNSFVYSNSADILDINSVVQEYSALWILSGGSIDNETDPIFIAWAQTYSAFFVSSYNTVLENSGNWESVYNVVFTQSANWQPGSEVFQILSYDENNALLSISDGNTISLSSLTGGSIDNEIDPLFTTWASTNSANYESTYLTVTELSTNWQDVYNNLTTFSSDYLEQSDLTELQSNSSQWNSNYNTVLSNSSQWNVDTNDGDLNVNNFVYSNSADILEIESVVQSNSSLWILSGLSEESDPLFVTWAQTYSSNYERNYNTVLNNSSTWNYQGIDVKSITADWQNAYNNLITFSSEYLEQPNLSEIQSNSSLWNSNYNTVLSNSSTWNYQGTDIKELTADWQNAYNNLITNSALYLIDTNDGDLNVNNFVYTNSADILDIESIVQNNSALWILSGLSVETDPIFSLWAQNYSAKYENVSMLFAQQSANNISVYNTVFTQSAHWQPGSEVFQILSYNEADALLSISDGNTVSLSSLTGGGIDNETDPLFSTWAQTYTSDYESNYNTVFNNSANWNYQGTDIKSLTSFWQNAYNNLIAFSSDYLEQVDLSEIRTVSSNWNDSYTNLVNNSALYLVDTNDGDLNVNNFVYSNSADILDIESIVQNYSSVWILSGLGEENDPIFTSWVQIYSANYESTFNTVLNNSSTWNYQGTDIKELTSVWQDAYTNLISFSAEYLEQANLTEVQNTSSNWNESYENLINNSALYLIDTNDGDLNVNSFIYANSADIFDINTTVKEYSALWILSGLSVENDPIFSVWAQNYSANYESVYNIVNTNSSTWNYQGTDIKELTSVWQNAYNNLIAFSSDYLQQPDLSLSSNWTDVYNTVNENSAAWNIDTNDGDLNVNFFVYSNSADILDINSVVQNHSALWILSGGGDGDGGPENDPIFTSWAASYSANYESTYNTVLNNSSTWGAGGTPQTLSFDVDTSLLTISDGNSISLSSLAGGGGSSGGGGGSTQFVVASSITPITTTSQMPTTAPQNTDGDEVITATITPKSASSKLEINFDGWISASSNGTAVVIALFQDAIAQSIQSSMQIVTTANHAFQIRLTFIVNAGNTDTRTYKIRFGPIQAVTATMLRNNTTADFFDDSDAAFLTITEHSNEDNTACIGITIDGAGNAITTGIKGFASIPYNCVITSATLLANVSGDLVMDIRKATFTDYPTTTSICASALPTLSSEIKSFDNTLSGWDTIIDAGDIIEYVVDSTSTLTKATLTLAVNKI